MTIKPFFNVLNRLAQKRPVQAGALGLGIALGVIFANESDKQASGPHLFSFFIPCHDGFNGELVRSLIPSEQGTYHALSCGVIEAYKKNPWTPYEKKPGEDVPPPSVNRA